MHNRLQHEQLEKLVFIYNNIRLLRKHLRPKDLDLIILDKIDLDFEWVFEGNPPGNNFS